MDNDDNPTPPNIQLTTTPQILRQTASIVCAHVTIFLFITSLLFTFHSNVHTASHYLSSLIDRNPNLKTFLSRLDLSDKSHHHLHHRRRRPFLHLSRVGTIDEDFFSGDSHFDRSLFHPSHAKHQDNASVLYLNPNYAFPDSVTDNGIHFPSLVRPGVLGFRSEFRDNVDSSEGDEDEKDIGLVESGLDDDGGGGGGNPIVDLNFFIKGFEMGHPETTSLFFLAGLLSAAYAYVVLAFIVTYIWVGGIVFVKVLDSFLGRHRSFFQTVWAGSNVGIKRLSGLIMMKWAVRDALAQLIGIYFFGEIEDQYVFFKVFLRMKFIPFANVAPWVIGQERESMGFILIWFLSDLLVGFLFPVVSWVAIVDSRRSGREIVTEGFHMLLSLFGPAFEIRLFECIICGALGRWMLRRICGEALTVFLQSLMEVYFTVAWLVFYFAARHKADASLGRTFGRRELQALVEVAR